MIVEDFKDQFEATVAQTEDFFALMQRSFSFYLDLCDDFFNKLAENIQEGTLDVYLEEVIHKKLFDPIRCNTLGETRKQFLAAIIKIEQFQGQTNYQADFLNDLENLQKIADRIYQLLQTHWELFRYQKSAVNNKTLIEFLQEIDRIGISCESYFEKYQSIGKILTIAGGLIQKEGYASVDVRYHVPKGEQVSLKLLTDLVQFLQSAYEFVLTIYDSTEEFNSLEILNLAVLNPIQCMLIVPNQYQSSYVKFLNYLSVDIIKKETLLKFVMEVVRLEKGKELSKAQINSLHKKIGKQLENLHPEGYVSVNEKEKKDSVTILTHLCSLMDELKITYKDILNASTTRIIRNRTSSTLLDLAIRTEEEENSKKKEENNSKQFLGNSTRVDTDKKEYIGILTT